MNLIEAVKSGKQFRLPNHKHFSEWGYLEDEIDNMTLTRDEILSEEWEVEDYKITISKSEFEEICKKNKLTDPCEFVLLEKALFGD